MSTPLANSLSELTVLNTRPNPMGEQLSELLANQHIHHINAPAIGNTAISAPLPDQVIEQINNPDSHWIFVSRAAVRYFQEALLQQQQTRFNVQGHIFAIGQGTKEQLLQAFANDHLNIQCPDKPNSESLLTHSDLQPVNQKQTIVLIKGKDGRELITDTLRQRNYQVIEVPVYQRQAQDYAQAGETWQYCNVILATSVDIAQSVLNNLSADSNTVYKQQILTESYWLTLSERIKNYLVSQHITERNIIVCEEADNVSIVEKIKTLAK